MGTYNPFYLFKTSLGTNLGHLLPSGANAMSQKGNDVLYVDKELVEKSKERMCISLCRLWEYLISLC
jgi:hypothetical protein